MSNLTQSVTPPDQTAAKPANLGVIWLLLGAAFVVILNETIMGVAIPNLVDDLGITLGAAQWLTTAFMLTMAVIIPITGFLLERFTTRQVFTAAMTSFSIGTLTAAIAPGFEVLLVGRIIQATGTAMMMPLLMTTIMTLVPADSRGRFMGRISIVMAAAPALGPTISGIILSVASWRFMFWLVLPIALAMLILGNRKIQNIGEAQTKPIDALSVILSALGFGGLIFGLSLIGGQGNAAVQMWIALGTGVLGVAAFVWRQLVLQRSDKALLDLRVFKSRSFTIATSLMVIVMGAMFGTIILLPIYMQNVLGLTPVVTGMMLLPGGLLMGLIAPVVGRIFDKHGPRPLVIPGGLIVSAVLWTLTLIDENTAAPLIVAAHVLLSLGLAFMFTPLFTSALGSLKPSLYSHGSATVGTIQQVAGAAGTSLFVTIMSVRSVELIAGGTPPITAEATGIQAAFMIGAVISVLAVVGTFFIRRPAEPTAEPVTAEPDRAEEVAAV